MEDAALCFGQIHWGVRVMQGASRKTKGRCRRDKSLLQKENPEKNHPKNKTAALLG